MYNASMSQDEGLPSYKFWYPTVSCGLKYRSRIYTSGREVKKASIGSTFSSGSFKILNNFIHLRQILPAYLWLTVDSWPAPLEGSRPTNDGCWLENGWDSPHFVSPGYAHALFFHCLVISTLPAWNQRCESYSRWQGPGSLGSRLEGTSRNLTPNEARSKRTYRKYEDSKLSELDRPIHCLSNIVFTNVSR